MHRLNTYTLAPFEPATEVRWHKRLLWILPMLLSIAFVGLIVRWAEVNDARERVTYENTLAADSQSVETQLHSRKDAETAKLKEAAAKLALGKINSDSSLQAMPEIAAGMDRLWNRVVWIDADNQIIARAVRPDKAHIHLMDGLKIQSSGQVEHLAVDVQSKEGRPAGQLLARYEITDLLQSTDLAWLNRRYQVDFLSELGEVIATTALNGKYPDGGAYERPLSTFKDTTLRLTPFEEHASWRSNARTLALLGGLLLLGGAASHLLKREATRVMQAIALARTEAAWRQSMEDSALVGLRARDLTGRILYVNKTLCEMVGYGKEELVGLIPPLPFWPKETMADMMARNSTTLAGDAPTDGYETRWSHRDGHLIDVLIYEAPLVNSQGTQIGWMGSIIDISERKLLEEKERRHVETMAQHARLNDMGLIASELAHELNQPLTSITSYSAGLDIALKKLLPHDAELLKAVNAVHRNASKAGDIVNWIRRQSSRSESARAACNINDLVTDSLEQRRRQLRRGSVQVYVDLAVNLPLVSVDRIGIEQVITNLVRNAADAMEAQSGARAIWIATKLNIPTAGAANAIELVVRDSGPGLNGISMDTLCSTFYSTKQSGMGLGLGICRAIVESHGGRLTAQDAVHRGAEFRFTIPI